MNRAFLGGLTSLLLPLGAYGYAPRSGYIGQPRALPGAIEARFDPRSGVFDAPLGVRGMEEHSGEETLSLRAGAAVTELLVLDGSAADAHALLRGLRPGVDVVEIDPALPGLPQLAVALSAYRGLAAIHVVSHAEAGVLRLGNSRVDAQTLRDDRSALAVIRGALRPGGDLLLYGCDAAADSEGEALLDLIAASGGIDVVASNTLTGAAALGGDWDLEIRRGDIEAAVAFDSRAREDFSGVLAAADGTFNFFGWSGANTNTLTTTDFTLTARTGGGVVATLRIGGGGAAYMNGSGGGDGNYFYLRADGANTGQFELTGVRAQEYGYTSLDNLRIVGYLPGGGQITSSVVNGTSAGGEALAFTGTELVAFQGQPIKGFKFFFDCESGPCNPGDLDFVDFSIINAEAPALPTVTDGRISISGASGTGGAYRIGDTVTATWDNTAGGDANSGIVGVTVDFSQFGGGAAVAASNSANTWTATYTIAPGAIDAINRNVSVTATNSSGNTTTADSTNATVDNVAPTVTDANISLSGATGTAGAFRIGDTVTATWNDTAVGDNNSDTLSGVTVDFSQFGGGASVTASNSGGTWTASYLITAGAIQATGLNVGVTASDNAGNATTTADSSNATLDNVAPVASIVVTDTLLGSGETSAVTVSFSEAVSGFTNADLTIANGTLSPVSTFDGGTTWTATLTPSANVTDASNVISLDNSGVVDAGGNPGSGTTDSNNYAVDTEAPTATLVVADSELLAGETAPVTITFSEAVSDFTNADLAVPSGALSTVSSADGGLTWTATFTPDVDVYAPSNVITLDNTGVIDAAGNTGAGTTDSNVFAVRTLALTLLVTSPADTGDDATTTASLAADIVDGDGLSLREALFWVRPGDTISFDLDSAVAGNQGGTIVLGGSQLVIAAGNILIDGDLDDDGGADVTISGNGASRVAMVNINMVDIELNGLVLTQGNASGGGGGLAIGSGANVMVRNCRFTNNVAGGFGGGGVYGSTATLTMIGSTVSGNTSSWFGGGIRLVGNGTLNLVSSTVSGNTTTGIASHGGGIQLASGAGGSSIVNSTISGNAVLGASSLGGGLANSGGPVSVHSSTIVGNAASGGAGGVSASGTETLVNTVVAGNTSGAGATAGSAGAPLATGGIADDVGGTIETATHSYFGTTATIITSSGSLNNQGTASLLLDDLAQSGTRPATHAPLDGTVLADAGSNAALPADTFDVDGDSDTSETLPLDANGNARINGTVEIGAVEFVDAIAPTVISLVVTETLLIIGESSPLTITFSEPVTGLMLDDLTVENASLSGLASADGGITWTASLSPDLGVTDADNLVTLDNAGFTDLAGNPGTGTTTSNNYAIDTLQPTAVIDVADAVLSSGDTTTVTITFNEAVSGFGNADLTVPNGTLDAVTTGDGGITWTATLTPAANTSAPSNAITLANTGVMDLAGNVGQGSTLSNSYAVQTTSATSAVLVADSSLILGETSLVTITFSEAVSGLTAADLSIANGTVSEPGSIDSGLTWSATLTPTAGIESATNTVTLNNAGVTTVAGGNPGSGTTVSNNYGVDTLRPTAVIAVADTALTSGDVTTVTITFSEAVSGFENADLTVPNGTLNAVTTGDGGITWTATLTPAANTSAPSNQITLNNAGVNDLAGNPGSGSTLSNVYAVSTATYTVGGQVVGLSGVGLVLRNNGGDDLAVGSNGAFTFSTPLADGESYLVTVATQPSEQNCEVAQGSGSIAAANVTTVVITCNDLVNVPGAPTAVTATPGDRQINVSWAAPADDGGSPITGYRATATLAPGLKLGAAGVGASCTTTGATQCSILGLVNGTPYLVRVVALNANGEGASGSAAAAVTPVGAPAAPTAITVQRAADSATVSWAAPANDGGSPITGYTVIAQPGGASCTVSGNPPPTSCTLSGLNPNLQYTFSVTASNAAGTGDPGTAIGVGNLPVPRVVPVNSPLTLLVLAIASLLMAWRRLGRQSLAQDLGRSSKGGER